MNRVAYTFTVLTRGGFLGIPCKHTPQIAELFLMGARICANLGPRIIICPPQSFDTCLGARDLLARICSLRHARGWTHARGARTSSPPITPSWCICVPAFPCGQRCGGRGSVRAARCPQGSGEAAGIRLRSVRCPQQAPTCPLLPWGPALSSCGWTVGGCVGWEQGGGGQGPSQREG